VFCPIAIIGFALFDKGFDAIEWKNIRDIVIFWMLTPVFSGLFDVAIFIPLKYLLLRREDSYVWTRRIWPLFVFMVTFVMVLFLFLKGLKRLDLDYTIEESSVIAALVGVVVAGILFYIVTDCHLDILW